MVENVLQQFACLGVGAENENQPLASLWCQFKVVGDGGGNGGTQNSLRKCNLMQLISIGFLR